jgi:hypothetical protein
MISPLTLLHPTLGLLFLIIGYAPNSGIPERAEETEVTIKDHFRVALPGATRETR